MGELVCGMCDETIGDQNSNCPYCGAEPSHFVYSASVDRALLCKIYDY